MSSEARLIDSPVQTFGPDRSPSGEPSLGPPAVLPQLTSSAAGMCWQIAPAPQSSLFTSTGSRPVLQ
jgi:hypothetical protein